MKSQSKILGFFVTALLAAGSIVTLGGQATAAVPTMQNAEANTETCAGLFGPKQSGDNRAQLQIWRVNEGATTAVKWKNVTSRDLVGRVPVVMIHGWTGHATEFNNLADNKSPGYEDALLGSTLSLASEIPNAVVYTFDYHNASASWVDNDNSGKAFRTALACINRVTQQRAIVVTHSMGGLVTRYALDGKDRWVSRVVTYNTPETGSVIARALNDQLDAAAAGDTSALGNGYWTKAYATKAAVAEVANLARLVLDLCGTSAGVSLKGDLCSLDKWGPVAAIGSGETPAARALMAGSREITTLKKWPAGLPVDALGGEQIFTLHNIVNGIFDNHEDVSKLNLGDPVVTPDSATAYSTGHNIITCKSSLTFRDQTFWRKFMGSMVDHAIDAGLTTADIFSNGSNIGNFFGGPCFHSNAMKSIEQTSYAQGYIGKQVSAQTQAVTYDATQAQNYGNWTVGVQGVGPYRIGQRVTDITAAYKKVFPEATGINYSQSILDTMNRAFDGNYANLGGKTGDMLACSALADYGIVAARYRTPSLPGNLDRGTYIQKANPAAHTTLSEVILSSDMHMGAIGYNYPSLNPETATDNITLGSTAKAIEKAYGSARYIDVADADSSLSRLRIKRYTITTNVMNANGELQTAYLNFFLGAYDTSNDWRVIQITAGTDTPRYYAANTCSDLDRVYPDGVGYVKSQPKDFANWTLGFGGAGPLTYGVTSLQGAAAMTGTDYHNSKTLEYSGFGNFDQVSTNYPDLINTVHADYMSEYGLNDEQAWQRQEKYGLNMCTPLFPTNNVSLGASFSFPFIRSGNVQNWLKLNPYGASHISDIAVSGSPDGLTTGSGPSSLGNHYMLPRTSAGLGLGSTLPDIRAAYPSSRYTVRDWVLPTDITTAQNYAVSVYPFQRMVIVEDKENPNGPALYFILSASYGLDTPARNSVADRTMDKVFLYGVSRDMYKYGEITTFRPCVAYAY